MNEHSQENKKTLPTTKHEINLTFTKQGNKNGSRKGISGWMDAYYFSTIALPRKNVAKEKENAITQPSEKTDITVLSSSTRMNTYTI